MKTFTLNSRRRAKRKEDLYHNHVYHGTLLIPDISGFTDFVRSTDLTTGKNITSRLLSSIISSNHLGLQVSEIEGDAILFYKYEKKFSVAAILKQFEVMLESFNQELALLSEELGLYINLTLKLVAHYGKLADYRIGRFQKLYGETVIEAHRLLKNSIKSDTYVLITDELLENIDKEKDPIGRRLCNKYTDIKSKCFTFFDYQPLRLPQLTA